MKTNTVLLKIFYFPLTRIIIGIVAIIGAVNIAQIISTKLLDLSSMDKDVEKRIVAVISAIAVLVTYATLYKYYEKRKISELSTRGIWKNLLTGLLLGAALQSSTILVIYIFGGYSITSVNSILFILPSLAVNTIVAVLEEVFMRGIIFRIVEEKLGSYIALGISAIIFGALHLANPNSSLTAALQVAIEAGILLAAAYMYSRSLWFTIAIHFAWNFTQSGIYGANTSGHLMDKSLLTADIHGANWLTGGQFGPEGSVQATIFCLAAGIILLILCYKQHKVIEPHWKRND